MNALFEWLISIINEFRFWVIVQPWERAVRTRAGKGACVLESGLHFRVPVIDAIQVLNSRTRSYPFPSTTIISKDRKAVTVAGVVGFSINDPLQVHMAMKEPETIVSALALRAAAAYITGREFEGADVGELNEHIAAELAANTNGLTFEFVNVTEFGAFGTLRLLQENWRPYTGMDRHGE